MYRINGEGVENSTSVEVEEDEIICKCFQVKENEIRSYIAINDVTEVEDVTSACEAGGNCGSCHILIQFFIDQNKHKSALAKIDPLRDVNSKNQKESFWKNFFTNS